MILANPTYGDDIWERVEEWKPTDLSAFVGVYASDEAESVLRVAIENGKLAIRRRPNSSFALTPTYTDGFQCSFGSVLFLRDAGNKIVGLRFSDPRVWSLRFTREEHGDIAAPQ